MTPTQAKYYKEMKKNFLVEAENDPTNFSFASNVISQMVKLKELSISPELLGFEERGSKLQTAIDLIEDYATNGRKIVIFSQFKKSINLIIPVLQNLGIKYSVLTGDVKDKDRQAQIDFFQNGDHNVLLATIQTGGEGITLTAAHTEIFIDRMWTPAVNIQAEDRCHRIGQKNAVTIIVLVTKKSIDSDIEDVLQGKSTLIAKVLKEKSPIDWVNYLKRP
jgi:SNF2 family DNA or RNA helicase